ncbi:lipopolysaccharide heptosyltransferase II [Candidatus Halobeggiatoa sp. HSG11]|nr:lipopolysaccharide heptosyltransferase II [Candidatus Halobeggiatoa sp. HSG11]
MQTNSILVIGPSWVGDIVMAQSLFKIIKREQPDVKIDVLAPSWSAGLLKRMPEIRYVLHHNLEHGKLGWKERRKLATEIRNYQYQQAIMLPNSWKSALIPFFAKIPKRTGYLGEMRYGLLNDIRKKKFEKTISQFVALGLPKNDPKADKVIPKPLLNRGNIKKSIQKVGLTSVSNRPILALCPGAEYGAAKRWPVENYITCAKYKISKGWQVWIFGSEKEVPLGAEIQSVAGKNCISLCGKTALPEVIDLLSISKAIICNDSGLMHVAAALNKPLVAVFGSSNPNMTPPLSNQARIISLKLKCSPCYQRNCPKKHLKCLRDITPAKVMTILNTYEQKQKVLQTK